MRKTKTCPKCSSQKLLDIATVADWGGGTTSPRDAQLAVRFRGESFGGSEKREAVGKLGAVTCSECGYTELYVADPEALQPDGRYITWLR